MDFSHIPVLLQECLDGLAIRPDGLYLDGTAGGAGHSGEIARRLTTGHLYSLDQDPDAIAVATQRLAGLPATVLQSNFRNARAALAGVGITGGLNGALLDLGVSSHQLDDAERGFSYRADAPLDMRMSQSGPTAADFVNTKSREEIAKTLREFGEEPCAWQIAGRIVARREGSPSRPHCSWPTRWLRLCRRPCAARTKILRAAPSRPSASRSTASWTRSARAWTRSSICLPRAGASASSPSIRWKTAW